MEKEQGRNARLVFNAESNLDVVKQVYGSSESRYLPCLLGSAAKNNNSLNIADFGGYFGDLSFKLKKDLESRGVLSRVYGFDIILPSPLMKYDKYTRINLADEKSVRGLNMPFLADVGIMRFVLPWNSQEDQSKVIANALSLVKDYIIIESIGPVNSLAKNFREMNSVLFSKENHNLFNKENKNPLYRENYCFLSAEETEEMLKSEGVKYKLALKENVSHLEDLFICKYDLSPSQGDYVRKLFAEFPIFKKSIFIVQKS